ncbi:hypothetical protein WR25_07431 [Diploscapter pachys]|uniref:AMP-dependent synthetase/ligase domain-containing protein n=1 Tax=Diploscapter pachys TaxID=2018661 RepID=A0A2A2JSY5_9BILA|nr:hypothetical protein WR25_07431 [Diploscapter pachys]
MPGAIVKSPFQYDLPSEAYHIRLLNNCRKHAEEDPEKYAFTNIDDESDKVTFAQVHDYAMGLSGWLTSSGFKKGDILYLSMANCWQFNVTMLGAWHAGLAVSAASPQFTHFEHNYQLKDLTAQLIVTDAATLPTVTKAAQGLNVKKIICIGGSNGTVDLMQVFKSESNQKAAKPAQINLKEDIILLPYSSGTTGSPKGVMINHLNYSSMLSSYVKKYDEEFIKRGYDGYMPAPLTIQFLPFYHAMGLFGMLFHFYNGTPQIIMAKFNLRKFLQTVVDEGIMTIMTVPAVLLQLVESGLMEEFDLSCLLVINVGSAPLAHSIINQIKQKLPDVTIAQGFGMTEFSVAAHIATAESPIGSCGVLMPNTEMKVVKDDGTLCGPNEEGECWIRGPQVMSGYWRRPEQTAESMDKEGFVRTGDIVHYDEKGNTFITDRIKELIKVNGKQVPPAELESVLYEHPLVLDACVVGIPDQKSGELPRAYVVRKSNNLTEKEINDFIDG